MNYVNQCFHSSQIVKLQTINFNLLQIKTGNLHFMVSKITITDRLPVKRRLTSYILPLTIAREIASVIPILLMVRIAEVLTFRVIHSPVSGMKNFFNCRFGLNLRLVLWFEWLTLLPTIDDFPVKSQILDMTLY